MTAITGCAHTRGAERAFPHSTKELRAHLAGCEACHARWRELDELASLGRELPAPELTAERRDAMRDAVLARVTGASATPRARRRPERRVFWMAAAALLLGVVGILLALTRGDSERSASPVAELAPRGAVHAHGAASVVRVGKPGDEVVRLIDGTITVEVQPLLDGERFRVVTGDAEVEVRGTAFDVVARDDHLVSVRVLHGKVEVRPEVGPIRLLGANERWTPGGPDAALGPPRSPGPSTRDALSVRAALEARARAAEADAGSTSARPEDAGSRAKSDRESGPAPAGEAEAPAQEPSAARAQRPSSRRSDRVPTRRARPAISPDAITGESSTTDVRSGAVVDTAPEVVELVNREPLPVETSYQRAWDLLRAGDARAAADGFAAVLAEDPSGGLAEDAAFWRAVALGRVSGERAAAIMAFRSFLSDHPSAVRAAEASTMLGWLLVDEGALDRAQTRFEAAAEAQNPSVRDSSRRGLAEIDRLRSERTLP